MADAVRALDGNAIVVSKEDRLESEVLHLKMLNHTYAMNELIQQLHAKRKEQEELKRALLDNKARLEAKYAIDLDTYEISEQDGTVRPKRTPGGQFHQIIEAVKQKGLSSG